MSEQNAGNLSGVDPNDSLKEEDCPQAQTVPVDESNTDSPGAETVPENSDYRLDLGTVKVPAGANEETGEVENLKEEEGVPDDASQSSVNGAVIEEKNDILAEEEEEECAEECADVGAPDGAANVSLEPVLDKLAEIQGQVSKNVTELYEIRKLYHNEVIDRARSMQEELKHYHEVEKGRIFDDVLREIATIYSANISIVDKIGQTIPDESILKQLTYMFDDILQLLEGKGVVVQKSSPGDKRNPRHSHIIEKVVTSDPAKHDTVVESRHVGFSIDNRTLVPEDVSIYVYERGVSTTDNNKDTDEEK